MDYHTVTLKVSPQGQVSGRSPQSSGSCLRDIRALIYGGPEGQSSGSCLRDIRALIYGGPEGQSSGSRLR